MARVNGQSMAPWQVFVAFFPGRKPCGVFTKGPVDSFKVRACCTMFAAAAEAEQDEEVVDACRAVMGFFTGDCCYSDFRSGSAPDRAGEWTEATDGRTEADTPVMMALKGPDEALLSVLQLISKSKS
eukprot:TRINITY_DN76924_c0_g1_i1.p2 TRINITY_DN76924_c0_g1~~TRINITY_DN76924_c0_g1_i1.p2  ORF type:complete len:127 (-),score=18.18 TRINITY_DN76924_c0_g1_i1:31-411(-)